MVRIELSSAQDYINAGVSTTGTFAGADDGTITTPTGFEPIRGYFVNSEGGVGTPIRWQAPQTQNIIQGDGAGNPKAELLMELKVKPTQHSGDGQSRGILTVGSASAPHAGYCEIRGFNNTQTHTVVHIGEAITNQVQTDDSLGAGFTYGQWNKYRVEYKQILAGTINTATDIKLYVNDILISHGVDGSMVFDWNNSNPHGFRIGGDYILNNSLRDASYGDILISNDVTDNITPVNVAPTGSYNSITQRT